MPSPDIAAFLRDHFKSVWALELLLFLKDHGDSVWTSDQLVEALRTSETIVTASLATLLAGGLVSDDKGRVRFAPASHDLSRLVDIALSTDDLPGLDYVFERLSRLPTTDRSGSLAYARAKALYAKKDYAAAKNAVNTVPAGSPYTPKRSSRSWKASPSGRPYAVSSRSTCGIAPARAAPMWSGRSMEYLADL